MQTNEMELLKIFSSETPLSKSKIWQCVMYLAIQRRVLEEWQALKGTQSWRWMILPFFAVLPQAQIIFLFQAQTLLDALSLSLHSPSISFFVFLPLGLGLSVSSKSSPTPVCVQMAL